MGKFMRSVIGYLSVSAICLNFFLSPIAPAQEGPVRLNVGEANRLIGEVAIPYIRALQTGDVKALQDLIDGKLAITIGKLLSDNQEYPNFLREKFGKYNLLDSQSTLEQKAMDGFFEMGNDQAAGNLVVEMSKANGRLINLQLSLEKNKLGHWRVVDQKIKR